MSTDPFFSTVFVAVVAALVIQGIKSIFNLSDTGAKIVSVVVGALFFAANGILAIVVTDPNQQTLLAGFVGAVLALLKLFAPSGVYSVVKSLFRPE